MHKQHRGAVPEERTVSASAGSSGWAAAALRRLDTRVGLAPSLPGAASSPPLQGNTRTDTVTHCVMLLSATTLTAPQIAFMRQ